MQKHKHANYSRNARSSLVWGAALVALLHVAALLFIDFRRPGYLDAEYGARISAIRSRMEEGHQPPLLVVLGSSRMTCGVAPEILPAMHTSDQRNVLVFNFGQTAAGPCMVLMNLTRLLKAGIVPTWAIIQAMPPKLVSESETRAADCATLADLPLLMPQLKPGNLFIRYMRTHWSPIYRYRANFLAEFAPSWLEDDQRPAPSEVGPLGGMTMNAHAYRAMTTEKLTEARQEARDEYIERTSHFQIDPRLGKAFCDTLALCRQYGIKTVILISPEGPAFRKLYCPEAEGRLGSFLATANGADHLKIVDARLWLDEADFIDSHHPTHLGAEKFTRRLYRETLLPLVAGELGENVAEHRP